MTTISLYKYKILSPLSKQTDRCLEQKEIIPLVFVTWDSGSFDKLKHSCSTFGFVGANLKYCQAQSQLQVKLSLKTELALILLIQQPSNLYKP